MKQYLVFLSFLASFYFGTTALAKGFAVIGDTQRTLGVERIFLGRKQNDSQRERIVQALADAKPSYVVHLGDMVDWGGSGNAWDYYFDLMAPILQNQIPVHHVLGNHEYFGMTDAKARRKLKEIIPDLGDVTWRSIQKGPLLLILLNSNRSKLSKSEWKAQATWFQKTLQECDLDPSVQAALVFSHHPPYSNSKTVGDEEDVIDFFVPAFQSSKKALAYFSGHAHGYEHFLKKGRHFVVSGGGGGPRTKYHEGSKRKHEDLFKGPTPRPFHFLMLHPGANAIDVEVHGFYEKEEVGVLDRFTIPWSP
ncbi:MAG: metallophosphoesterase [Bdellovibrionales bacterium]|nr:metallophosphoesterase [Bdellovibrionales bacterium]